MALEGEWDRRSVEGWGNSGEGYRSHTRRVAKLDPVQIIFVLLPIIWNNQDELTLNQPRNHIL